MLLADGPAPDAGLVEAVKAYLAAEDDAGRDDAAKALVPFDGASVKDLRAALKAAVVWEKRSGPIEKKLSIAKGEISYIARLPKGYDPAKAYGLLYWISGPGTNADWAFGTWTPEKLGNDYVVASATMPADDPDWPGYPNWDTADQTLEAVLTDLGRTVHIDPDRVFAGGFSMGGAFSWSFAAFQGDRLAGAIPGAGHPPDNASPNCLRNTRWCPLFVVHGEKDEPVPIRLSRDAVAKIKGCGGYSIVYKELKGWGHAWPAQVEGELIEWMGDRRRNRDPKNLFLALGWWVNPNRRFYWIQAVKGSKQGELEASITGNTVTVKAMHTEVIALYLNEALLDLDAEVVVMANGQEAWRGKAERSARLALDGFRERWHVEDLHNARVVVNVPQST